MKNNGLKWIKEDGNWYPISGETTIYNSPGKGIFQLFKNPNPQDGRLGLRKLDDEFKFDFKPYDLDCNDFQNKVIKTWNSEYFISKDRNLGVILNGTKGTGKTVAAKLLCNATNLPVIIIPYYIRGVLEFIQGLDFEAAVLIDEAEKTFMDDDEDNSSQILLKMIDGVYNRSRKLYILTTNSLDINENLVNRPGRINYIKQFSDLPAKMVKEYVQDNLINKNLIDDVYKIIDRLEFSTIDILKFLVDEMNIHGEIDNLLDLNIPLSKCNHTVLYLDGQTIEGTNELFDTFISEVQKHTANLSHLRDIHDWLYKKSNIPEKYHELAKKYCQEFKKTTSWGDLADSVWDAYITNVKTTSLQIKKGDRLFGIENSVVTNIAGNLIKISNGSIFLLFNNSEDYFSLYRGELINKKP
jgi:hypothetical protein